MRRRSLVVAGIAAVVITALSGCAYPADDEWNRVQEAASGFQQSEFGTPLCEWSYWPSFISTGRYSHPFVFDGDQLDALHHALLGLGYEDQDDYEPEDEHMQLVGNEVEVESYVMTDASLYRLISGHGCPAEFGGVATYVAFYALGPVEDS
jgi:hypothetical protein